jgi:hypothetical protein
LLVLIWLVLKGVDLGPILPIYGSIHALASLCAIRAACGRRQYRRRRPAEQVPDAARGLNDSLSGNGLLLSPCCVL